VQFQRGQRFAGLKFEIAKREIAFLRGRRRRFLRPSKSATDKKYRNCQIQETQHLELLRRLIWCTAAV
jgi:hypothetical protein